MRSDRRISTIDFHTAGIGMRLFTSGLGRLPGSTIAEKRREFQERLDTCGRRSVSSPAGIPAC
jgi:proline racemase